LFYEPIPSAIRTVQRRGRTGRHAEGKVMVLIAKGTRDEAFKWSAHHKEKRMYSALRAIQKSMVPQSKTQQVASWFGDAAQGVKAQPAQQAVTLPVAASERTQKVPADIIVDYREKSSALTAHLIDCGCRIGLAQLSVGDYLVSDKVCIEYKTAKDFVDSMLDGRLLSQLKELRRYPQALLLIEGEGSLYEQRNVHPNAVRGMLSTIAVTYQIPVLYAANPKESAEMILAVLRRQGSRSDFQYHQAKPQSSGQQQEFLVSALPGVGSSIARGLLDAFGSIESIMAASVQDLQAIDKVGPRKAQMIYDLVRRKYVPKDSRGGSGGG
ncbi:MAG: ERCC4 domain-containing protein, partial [Nanoarchaeota archaeon]